MYTQSTKALFLDMRCLFFEMADELVASASSKKKAYQRRRIMSSSEEENYQNGRARAKSDSETSLGSAAMDDRVNDFEKEIIACKHSEENSGKRKRRIMIPSDDEEDESTLEQVKKLRTERGRNVRRKNRRDHKQKGPSSKACNAAEGSSEESEVSSYHGSDERSEDESDLDLSSVDEDSESQDSASSSLERSCDESGPENFGVDEVTKSQELLKPGKEQLFRLLVESLLRIIMGALWEGNDDYFKKAQTYWERLINTKKESVVASSKWRDYKEMLMNYVVVNFLPLKQRMPHTKCEACLMLRFLTERVVCYEELDGEVKQKFKVCQSCAAKGSVYHDLHHYKQPLKKKCTEQLEKVQQMAGTETPEGIIKKCLDDERWLDRLFSQFQSTLDAANKWAID